MKFLDKIDFRNFLINLSLLSLPLLILSLFLLLNSFKNLNELEFEQKCISYYIDNNGYKLNNCDYYIKKLEEKND